MQVKALVDCFVDGTYRNKGDEFDYAGKANKHLRPLKKADADADAKAKAEADAKAKADADAKAKAAAEGKSAEV